MPIYEIFIDGKPRKIEITKNGETTFAVKIDGKPVNVNFPSEKPDFTTFSLTINDKTYRVELPKISREEPFSVKVEDVTFKAEIKTPAKKPSPLVFEPTPLSPTKKISMVRQTVEGAVVAPMTGKILSIKVKKGDEVKAGQVLCVLEAMKMENEITTPKAGFIKEIYVFEGSSVSEGEPLFIVG